MLPKENPKLPPADHIANPLHVSLLKALITFVEVYPTDLILYSMMTTALSIPQALQVHIKVHHGIGTIAVWIKIFQWGLDSYPTYEFTSHIHDTMHRAGMVLRYRTFICDYHLLVLRPESHFEPQRRMCFPFNWCSRGK